MIIKSYKGSIGDVELAFEHNGKDYLYMYSGGLAGARMSLIENGLNRDTRVEPYKSIAELARQEATKRYKEKKPVTMADKIKSKKSR